MVSGIVCVFGYVIIWYDCFCFIIGCIVFIFDCVIKCIGKCGNFVIYVIFIDIFLCFVRCGDIFFGGVVIVVVFIGYGCVVC